MNALRSKRREVFLFILGRCYTTLDAKLFEDRLFQMLHCFCADQIIMYFYSMYFTVKVVGIT